MTYAANLIPALRVLAEAITAAGVPTRLSREAATVPGGWLRPDTIEETDLAGGGTAHCSLLIFTQAAKDEEVLADLASMLDKCLTVLTPDDEVDTSVVISVRNNSLPAFRVPVDIDL